MQNIQKLRHHRKLSGFTLVELIVVITILVILGTIAFIQLQGFSGSARDSARIENLSNLQKGLTLFQIKSGTYPLPENSVNITASGTSNIIAYQGFAKDQIGSIANLSKWGTQDPLDPTMYTTYSVNTNQTKMQIMTFLEDSSTVTAFVPTTYASATSDYSKRYPKTLGDTLWILLSTATGTLNQPVQETNTGVDVVLTNTGYLAVFSKGNSVSGSGNILSIVSSMGAKSCSDLLSKDWGKKNKDGVYYINPTGTSSSSGIFQVYCDMSTDDGGWSLWMKFKSTGSTFSYDSSYWDNTATLNETSLDLSDVDAKFASFHKLSWNQLRFCMDNGWLLCINKNYSGTLKDFVQLQTTDQIWYVANSITDTKANAWIQTFWFTDISGIYCNGHYTWSYTFVRIGVNANNIAAEGCGASDDFVWGFWLKNMQVANTDYWAWFSRTSIVWQSKHWIIFIR